MAVCCFPGDSARAADKKLPIKGEVFTINGRTAFLILPKQPKPDARIPWLWYAPTLRGLPGTEEKWMFEQFLARGIAIAGVDVGESYGSPAGRTIYSALHKELVDKRGLARQACLLARSRGGLMLYNWAVENPKSVACIAGIYPVCNLISYPGLARARGAYGMTEQQLAARLTEHNPIDRLAPLARAKVPIFHIHGDSDTVVPLEKNSGELARRYARLGGKMTLKIVKGQGHNMWSGWFRCRELVDFVIDHAPGAEANLRQAGEILKSTGVAGGLIVHVKCGGGGLTAALGAAKGYVVHGLDADAGMIETARRHIRSKSLGGRVSVKLWKGAKLPYAENLVNLLVTEDAGCVARKEIMRVLAPGGVAYVKQAGKWTKTVKPKPAELK